MLRNPDNVYRIISTETTADKNAQLQKIILIHNTHTPCGVSNPEDVFTNRPGIRFNEGRNNNGTSAKNGDKVLTTTGTILGTLPMTLSSFSVSLANRPDFLLNIMTLPMLCGISS